MRFADTDGAAIDVYQATTQMTDESDQSYPATINTLLDNATGPLGYYGVFTANMHTDSATSTGSDAIIAAAQAARRAGRVREPDARSGSTGATRRRSEDWRTAGTCSASTSPRAPPRPASRRCCR